MATPVPPRRRWPRALVALGIIVALVIGAGALAAARYAPLVDDVRAVRDAAQRLAASFRSLEPADVDRETVSRLRSDIFELDARLGPIRDVVSRDPVVDVARALPAVSLQLDAAAALVDAADSLIEAGELGLGLADRFVDLRERNASDAAYAMMPGMVELMATSGDEVDRIGRLIEAADARLAAIPPDAMGQIREARDLVVEPLEQYAPLLAQYREADDVLPGLLGWGERKRYLVLAQNPAELRPAGGYAGTIGVVAFEDGALVEQHFQDVYELDLQGDLPFIEPPAELANYLLGDEQSWRLADAAWAADFPTSARKALEFYALEADDTDLDGVIGITTYALDRLLEVVGPVTVAEYDVTVEPGDVTLTLLGETRGTPTSVEGRKDILDELSRTVTQRLLALPADRWDELLAALVAIGAQKEAVAWLDDDEAQELVVEGGWGGIVREEPGDYIYAVESNMAPTSKYNLVVDRSASLVVKIAEDGSALDSLRLDWQNDAGRSGQPYQFLRENSNNEEGWYGAYLRLLVPQSSELVAASGSAMDEIRGTERPPDEAGRAVFGNYLFMPPGEATMSYLWATPDAAFETDDGWHYRLLVQKQPGARPEPWTMRFDLPAGATVLEAPEGAVVDGSRIRLERVLDRDLELEVRYALPEDATEPAG